MMFKWIKKLFFTKSQSQVVGDNSTCIQAGGNIYTSDGCVDEGCVIVNGVKYTGKNISIRNGNIHIDGKNVAPKNEHVISITVDGNINELKVDACKSCLITGEVKTVRTMSGDVEITGNCEGDISTMSGDVSVSGNCDGNIKTVTGDVSTR